MSKIIRVKNCSDCPLKVWHPSKHGDYCEKLTEDTDFVWHEEYVMCDEITAECPLEDEPRKVEPIAKNW